MDPALLELNDNDLFWHARKKLNIINFGQFNGLPSREQILEAIRLYLENKDNPNQTPKPKTNKKYSTPGASNKMNETRRITRRTQLAFDTASSAAAVATALTDEPPQEQELVKETKKKVKKVKKNENKENNELVTELINNVPQEEEEQQQQQKQSKIKTKKKLPLVNQQEDEKHQSENINTETANLTKKNKNVALDEVQKTASETIQVKKAKKSSKKRVETEISSASTNHSSIQQLPDLETKNIAQLEVINKMADKKVKEKKSPKKSKKNKSKPASTTNDLIVNDNNTNQSDEFQLKLDEDEEELGAATTPAAAAAVDGNESVMTNDDEPTDHAETDSHETHQRNFPIQSQEMNITFDKSENETVPSTSTSSRLVSANIKPMYIEDRQAEPNTQQQQNTAESTFSCSSFYTYNNQQQTQQQNVDSKEPADEVKPKKGAKIVKPKIKVTNVELVIDSNANQFQDQETIKKVEIVQREAGPRIVKPAEANEIFKKKKTESESEVKSKKNSVSKTNSAKAPDFKAMHAKLNEGFESVSENKTRVEERHKRLLNQASKTPNRQSRLETTKQSSLASSVTVGNNLNTMVSKLSINSTTPKITKTKSHYSINASAQKNTNIPRMTLPKKSDSKSPNPGQRLTKPTFSGTTPLANRISNSINTPLAIKPKHSAVPPSAQKPYPFKENQNIEPFVVYPTNSIFTFNAEKSNLLATSAFNRRKSYDLNSSLLRPLNYKQHTGKLKPLDPVVPGVAGIGSKLTSNSTNLNDSKLAFIKQKREKKINAKRNIGKSVDD